MVIEKGEKGGEYLSHQSAGRVPPCLGHHWTENMGETTTEQGKQARHVLLVKIQVIEKCCQNTGKTHGKLILLK